MSLIDSVLWGSFVSVALVAVSAMVNAHRETHRAIREHRIRTEMIADRFNRILDENKQLRIENEQLRSGKPYR